MSICTIPQNQPIYLALLDKAASYPANKPYQAKAYKNAAHFVATMNQSIYDNNYTFYGWDAPQGSGIGRKIELFINHYIKIKDTIHTTKKPLEVKMPLCLLRAGATMTDYNQVKNIIRSNNPPISEKDLDSKTQYAFDNNVWKYILNIHTYEIDQDDQEEKDDGGYDSDVTECNYVYNGISNIITPNNPSTISYICRQAFKDNNWDNFIYGNPYNSYSH
jgi:hypothetical protein